MLPVLLAALVVGFFLVRYHLKQQQNKEGRPPSRMGTVPVLAARRAQYWTLYLAYAMSYAMGIERHVKLFRNGRSQAVRIPREFELPGKDAIMRKEGERLIIEPMPKKSLLALLATLKPLDEEFPEIPDLPAEPVDL